MNLVKKTLIWTLSLAVPIIICFVYYAIYSSNSDNEWSMQCSFREITGLMCPGCGGQRAIHHLLHGNIVKAFHYNALFVLGFPFLIYLFYIVVDTYVIGNKKHLNSFFFSSKLAIIFVIVMMLFFILRNIFA